MRRNAYGQLIRKPYLMFITPDNEGGGDGGGGDYKPPATQADLDKLLQERAARADRTAREDERKKFSDYDEVKAKAKALDEAQAKANAPKTDDEKRDRTVAELQQKLDDQQKRIDKAEHDLLTERTAAAFNEAIKGRTVKPESVFNLDRSSFTKDGQVDRDAIKAWVDANTNEAPQQEKQQRRGVPGQGERSSASNGGGVQAGRDLFDESTRKSSRKD